MSCKHCDLTFSDNRFEGAKYEVGTYSNACIEYWPDGEYDLVIYEGSWGGTETVTYVPITHCPWCGEELT